MVTFFPETGLPGAATFLAVGRCQAAALLLQRHSPCRPGGAEDAAVARLPRDPSSSSLGGVPRHAVLLASTNSPAGVSILA